VQRIKFGPGGGRAPENWTESRPVEVTEISEDLSDQVFPDLPAPDLPNTLFGSGRGRARARFDDLDFEPGGQGGQRA
jgi:hypothetical protein